MRHTETSLDADGGEGANLARGQRLPGAEHGLAARDVSARRRDVRAGRDGSMDLNDDLAADLMRIGVLDHHNRVGTPRQHPAGRDDGRRARDDLAARLDAGGQHLAVETQEPRGIPGGSHGIDAAHCEPVDARPLEPGNVDAREDVAREDAPERPRQGDNLRPEG